MLVSIVDVVKSTHYGRKGVVSVYPDAPNLIKGYLKVWNLHQLMSSRKIWKETPLAGFADGGVECAKICDVL